MSENNSDPFATTGSGKSEAEIAFELLSKLKGQGVWGERNLEPILDMYAECLDAARGLRTYPGQKRIDAPVFKRRSTGAVSKPAHPSALSDHEPEQPAISAPDPVEPEQTVAAAAPAPTPAPAPKPAPAPTPAPVAAPVETPAPAAAVAQVPAPQLVPAPQPANTGAAAASEIPAQPYQQQA